MSIPPYDGRRNPFMPRHDVVNSDAQAAPLYPHQLTLKESPRIKLSCRGGFPHKLKFRKRVQTLSPYSTLPVSIHPQQLPQQEAELPDWLRCSISTAHPVVLAILGQCLAFLLRCKGRLQQS